jgi:xanthosine utilization system XapX-like protein
LKRINREPVRYLGPFLFTAVLGVASMFGLIAVSALPPAPPEWLLASLMGITGTLVGWTLASLIPDLSMLVQFVHLQEAAAEVPGEGSNGNQSPGS